MSPTIIEDSAKSSIPGFPEGVNPETYRIGAVNASIRKSAYLPMLAVPDASRPNAPIFSREHSGRMIGVHVNEAACRLQIRPGLPCRELGVTAANTVGEKIATVSIRWMLCPDDFEAAPGREPPPTELDPTRSQRFVMLDGNFTFLDEAHSGFHAFGAGRTFPTMAGGKPQLELGSVITSLEGFGQMRGLAATNVVNGYIDPPSGMLLSFLWRVADPDHRLRSSTESMPPISVPTAPAGTTILALLGETDPDETVTLNRGTSGEMLGSNVVERLRLVRLDSHVHGARGIRSQLVEGPVVGSLRGTLHFNPFDPNPVTPICTSNGVLTFFDRCGTPLGRLFADIFEGRGFRMKLGAAPQPVYRLGGFGPFSEGEGCFVGMNGMMSLNAVVSVFPRTLTNMYLLRFNDPQGRLRATLDEAWL